MADPESDFWRSHWGLPGGAANGLGVPNVVSVDERETIAIFPEAQWVPTLWESMEGARVTTADAPERYAVIRRVEQETRSLIFTTAEAAHIQPGRALYFFDPDWNPRRLMETPNV